MGKYRTEMPRVTKALKEAYRERKNLSSGQLTAVTREEDQWVDQVMVRIRALEPAPSPFDMSAICEHMFWRFAPAAVLVVCLLSIWFFQVGATVEYDVASLFMTDPIGFNDMSSLGL